MEVFTYIDGELCAEQVPVRQLARQYGTPLYVYSRGHLREQYRALANAMTAVSPLICYSMKANSNAAVVRTLAGEGAGVDIVSGGELFRARRAGVDASRIVFAGVGKTRDEIEYALREKILFFTVESEAELARISECAAQTGVTASVAFRLNPDVDAHTHDYVNTGRKHTKFGLDSQRIVAAGKTAAKLRNVRVVGLHMHIGSQILSADPFARALQELHKVYRELTAICPDMQYVDIGGGLGISYEPGQQPLSPESFAAAMVPALKQLGQKVVIEPGRYLVGNAGILVCEVQYIKENTTGRFVITDAGMNDLIRPSLYQAYHGVKAVRETAATWEADLVGPVCESGDFFAQHRNLPVVRQGDLLAVCSAGAYGFSMASTYNSRPMPAEVMVDGSQALLIRRRGTREDLVAGETQ
jgi:diaminopimelate decarboxylase